MYVIMVIFVVRGFPVLLDNIRSKNSAAGSMPII